MPDTVAPAAATSRRLSPQARACLSACVKNGGAEQAWKHHHGTIAALARRGLVTFSFTGSYVCGNTPARWLDITEAGRAAVA